MDLILTGGHARFFEDLKLFASSLREKAAFRGKVIVCDNTIEGRWDAPGRYVEEASFGPEQLEFFRRHEVEVVLFHELLRRHGIPRDAVERIPTGHYAYPFKFFYATLLSKEHLLDSRNICFFDADVYFQRPLEPLFARFRKGRICIAPELAVTGKNPIVRKWIEETDLSIGTDQRLFLETLFRSRNYCTGFFGAPAATFNAFSLLCWAVADSRLASFNNDQPLANILFSFFGLPCGEAEDFVLHLNDVPEDRLSFDPGSRCFRYEGATPGVVHFNGGKKHLMKFLTDPACSGGGLRRRGALERLCRRAIGRLRRLAGLA